VTRAYRLAAGVEGAQDVHLFSKNDLDITNGVLGVELAAKVQESRSIH
tara:strand:+ start:783 stop:926 length:144 start_codon:yes stop_codon:yes gene_type:complete